MAEVKPRSTSCGEDTVELTVGEVSCSSGMDGSTSSGSVPPSIAAGSPSFFSWMWIHILTACSGVWGVGGSGSSGPSRVSGFAASRAGQQQPQEESESEVLSRIAASKSTWSEVPGHKIHHSVPVSRSSQLSVWEELKESNPKFFDAYWFKDLEIGRLIAEGGQAQIFEAKVEWLDYDLVVKVFKLDSGFSLADLKCHWPRSMRKNGEGCSESTSNQVRRSGFVFEDVQSNFGQFRCAIVGATLLKDGRFAFVMARYWGDLRTLIDLKVENNSHNTHPWEFDLLSQTPFSFQDSTRIMSRIAMGMLGLHAKGVIHRDLKAANVFIGLTEKGTMYCDVADYECAMFVQGTGFWRAPEVLQELLKNGKDRSDDIWTEKVDVYSFGMTCYEVLTGQIPFHGYTMSKWDDVIKGERPFLPNYIYPKLRELVEACWHIQPSQRPSFEVIIGELLSLSEDHTTWN